jgi:hypothetical protein
VNNVHVFLRLPQSNSPTESGGKGESGPSNKGLHQTERTCGCKRLLAAKRLARSADEANVRC